MLVVAGANALGGLGDTTDDLRALQSRLNKCVARLPITGDNDAQASFALSCNAWLGGGLGFKGIALFEKSSLLDQSDNAIMFNIARTVLSAWYSTGLNGTTNSTEAKVRRIAAQKLGEDPVLTGGPVQQALQTLSTAARKEPNDSVKLAEIASILRLLQVYAKFIEPSVRTEAITTLKILGDPNRVENTVTILNAANDALKSLAPKLEIGPVTVTTIPTPSFFSKYKTPLIAAGVTAAAAAGAIAWMVHRHHATALGAPGPLRRRAEAALRRRRAR